MIGTKEIRLLLQVHSGPQSENGRHCWFPEVNREEAEKLIKRGLLIREDDLKDDKYCYYEVTDEARDYVTFIKELLNEDLEKAN